MLAHPWARDLRPHEGHLVTPPLIGRGEPRVLLNAPGSLTLLRADPGMGGSRLLGEVRAHTAPGASLLLTPTVTTLQPLGSLRAALQRALAEGEATELEPELELSRERLLQGEGVTLDAAAAIVAAYAARAREGGLPGAIFLDDAAEIDAASLEACARAMGLGTFSLIARIDANAQVPTMFAALAIGGEFEIGPLPRPLAEQLAAAATGGALDREGQRRWSRLGACSPLGVLSAMRASMAEGEIAWVGKHAYPRRQVSGTGQVMHPSFWVARSAALASMPAQCVLAVITLAGGEAAVHAVESALEVAGAPVVARAEIDTMLTAGWLVETAPGWIALPTRTHRDAVLGELMDEETRHATHRALAAALAKSEKGLGLADVAFHSARAGDGKAAAKWALAAARQANVVGLSASATQLIAFAKREDPTCEAEAHRQLETSLASAEHEVRRTSSSSMRAVRVSGPPPAGIGADGEHNEDWNDDSPTIGPAPMSGKQQDVRIPFAAAPDVTGGPNAEVAQRLAWLAKEALVGSDATSLEQWITSLRAAGAKSRYVERLQALSRLLRGEYGDSLRLLRSARAELEGEDRADPHASLPRARGRSRQLRSPRRSAARDARRPRARASGQRRVRGARLLRLSQQIVQIIGPGRRRQTDAKRLRQRGSDRDVKTRGPFARQCGSANGVSKVLSPTL